MIEIIRQIPADYFLHFCGSGILYLFFRHIYNHRVSLLLLALISIAKEMYDWIYKPWSGFSVRDIIMNVLGIIAALLLMRVGRWARQKFFLFNQIYNFFNYAKKS